jgi:hypothetical protein
MNDPVIERVAREDPAAGSRSDTANVLLARLLHEIGDADPPPARVPLRRRIGHAAAPAAAVLVAVAVVVAAIGLLGHKSHPSSSVARPAHPVGAVALGSVRVAPGTEVLLAHGGALWIAGGHSLERLNPINGAVEAKIRLPIEGLAAGLAFGAGSGWVASGGANTPDSPSLVRFDPANSRILATIDVTGSTAGHVRVLSGGISFAAGRVWLSRDSTAAHGAVVSVNPATNRVDRPVAVGTGPETMLAAFGSLWVDNTGLTIGIKHARALPPSVARIDPHTRQVTTEPFSGAPSAGFGSLWVRHGDTITRYDPSTERTIARIDVSRVIAVAFGENRVWAVSGSVNTSDPNARTAILTQIDPRSNRIVGTPIHLQTPQPVAIAISGHDLWIADYQRGLLHFNLTRH